MFYKVWNPYTQQYGIFDKNTRWDSKLTVVVSQDGQYWSMAKRDDLVEIEAGLNSEQPGFVG